MHLFVEDVARLYVGAFSADADSDQKRYFSVRGLADCRSKRRVSMSDPKQQSIKPGSVRSKRAIGGPLFEPNAAGIDIRAREIFVAVPPDKDSDPVRRCETFTAMARELWHHHGGDGVHGSVLDSGLRCAGTARHQAVSGKSAEHEKRAR